MKKYDITKIIKTYQKDGQEKKVFKNIGELTVFEEGKYSVELWSESNQLIGNPLVVFESKYNK